MNHLLERLNQPLYIFLVAIKNFRNANIEYNQINKINIQTRMSGFTFGLAERGWTMTENDYLPYKAINVYINEDYLERILGFILKNKQDLPKEDQIEFANHFKKHVKILGFRKINRAPETLQLNAYVPAFEEKNEVVVFTLSTWTKIKREFAEKVKTWLKSQGWENLALERTFDESEGFLKKWPEGLTFDNLVENFTKAYPDLEFDRDDLILMVLWISGQLPEEQSEL